MQWLTYRKFYNWDSLSSWPFFLLFKTLRCCQVTFFLHLSLSSSLIQQGLTTKYLKVRYWRLLCSVHQFILLEIALQYKLIKSGATGSSFLFMHSYSTANSNAGCFLFSTSWEDWPLNLWDQLLQQARHCLLTAFGGMLLTRGLLAGLWMPCTLLVAQQLRIRHWHFWKHCNSSASDLQRSSAGDKIIISALPTTSPCWIRANTYEILGQ